MGRAAGPLVVVLVVVAVSLTGCGGSPSHGLASLGSTTTTSPSTAAQTPAADALMYADCMRSNGVTNYPDPSGNGLPHPPNQLDPNSPTFLTAYEACQKYAPNGEGGPPAPSVAQLRAALAFTQCMHKHGFPQFPDPWTTAPGYRAYLTMGSGMYFPVLGMNEVQSPAFRHAAKSCGVQLP